MHPVVPLKSTSTKQGVAGPAPKTRLGLLKTDNPFAGTHEHLTRRYLDQETCRGCKTWTRSSRI